MRLRRPARRVTNFASATVSPKPSPLLKLFAAAFIDGDRRLTDIAACRDFSMQARSGVANVVDRGEGNMPRAGRSIALPTGMIIGALYVILLVGFSRESYMRRDAASRAVGLGAGLLADDVSKRVCRAEASLCGPALADAGGRPSCVPSIEPARRFVGEATAPLTLEGLRRAMHGQP